MRWLTLILVMVVASVAVLANAALVPAQTMPEFKLGFKALADQIPAIVGEPVENEHYGPNGDSLQRTTTGLMVWRKADNWTAFTNGAKTWINGPRGLQQRGNEERFEWEAITPIRGPSTPSEQWIPIGPATPGMIRSMAVDPNWPDRRLLLAVRGPAIVGPPIGPSDIARSVDGGSTWALFPAPTEDLFSITLAPFPSGTPAAFAMSMDSIFRSADLGSSWQEVLKFPPARPELDLSPPLASYDRAPIEYPALLPSPDFATDGLALLVANGRMHRSDDAGRTWREVEPAAGQRVRQALFSPDFARDRTIFVVAISRQFPGAMFDRDPGPDNERSLGVLVSRDGGGTWTQVSQGLEVDGVPYRHVQLLALSPTFAQDGTLFAFGWGPRMRIQPGWGVMTALFRSIDRAASWQPVFDFGHYMRLPPYPNLALSPTFAADGLGFLSVGYSGQSPSLATCRMLRTDDGGRNWFSMLPGGSRENCGDASLVGEGSRLTVLLRVPLGALKSTDGGESWTRFPSWGGMLIPSPDFLHDRTIFTSMGRRMILEAGEEAEEGKMP